MTAIRAETGPLVIPSAILREVTYMLQREFGTRAVLTVLDDISNGAITFDHGERTLPREREPVKRFGALPLGFPDAAVIACAERRGGRVSTYDIRHFGVVGGFSPIEIVN